MGSTARNDIKALADLFRSTDESIVSQRHLMVIVVYLMVSAACAAPIAMAATTLWLRILLAAVLLVTFLAMMRHTVARVRALDEFEQLIAYRSLATAGFIAVWFVLFTGTVFLLIGFDNLFIVMALGPPEFWLCAALFMRGAENAYARGRDV
ncbi:MAG: hypothetical protein GKS06_05965 [Acidobacteria bacterium]|nr:hypothetical protein [Acidobacteriota bacterium]